MKINNKNNNNNILKKNSQQNKKILSSNRKIKKQIKKITNKKIKIKKIRSFRKKKKNGYGIYRMYLIESINLQRNLSKLKSNKKIIICNKKISTIYYKKR